jgi:orotate phosphoribosyltransferase
MDRRIASVLLEIEAVALSVAPPFTWASGRLSPIYCDNRLLMSHPEQREMVANGFKLMIERQGWKPDVIAGTSTAGIPHAAWLAGLMGLPMVYVRGAAKGHGKGNRIEGRLNKGQKVVLIEDLISTGGSSIDAAQGIIETGAVLLGVAAIFTYGLKIATDRFNEAGIMCATLTTFSVLMQEALEKGTLSPGNKAIIAEWQQDPAVWSASRGGAG